MGEPKHTVWKFPVHSDGLTDSASVSLPANAKVIHVDIQNNVLTLWAWVDPDAPVSARRILVRGTGHPAPAPWAATHLGTVFSGPYVWHVFDAGPVAE